jgi:RNA polymerase sigma-70 factor (ECF subfamily)
MDHPTPDSADQGEAFLRLMAEHERWLASYVYSLLPGAAEADDILQECKVVMWKQFARFAAGTNFRAWARTIALHQVLNHRRAEQRRPYAVLDREFIEAVAAEIDRRSDELDLQSEVLKQCLKKLPEAHRAIVVWRYYEDCGVEEIAAKTDRSVEAVYRLLSRIRRVLSECIQRNLPSTTAQP